MIWEFYQTEKEHRKGFTAWDIQMNGGARSWKFCNDPKNQRVCICRGCGIKIPREVPRIKFDASYHYGAGLFCMTCAQKSIKYRKEDYKRVIKVLQQTLVSIDELHEISEKVIANEFYEKKMALGKMLQIMSEKGDKR